MTFKKFYAAFQLNIERLNNIVDYGQNIANCCFHVNLSIFKVDVLARIVDREVGVGLSKWATADEIQSALVTVRDQPK
jgi:hypothetical protein